ncbi:MAG TPA: TetR/AcrR family transcriptional regulator [Nocardioides sp.]|nr:TetR/AcrR family transcriptional regulator [Nocardioides sp.]
MARYSREHKAVTRDRILHSAGRRLKDEGVERAGIAAVMADAGLTHGAFYAHFTSKDDLVASVVEDQIAKQRARCEATILGAEGLAGYVREYLSPAHRDHPGDGCPSAALLEDVVRGPDSFKRAYTDGMVALVDEIAAVLDAEQPARARADAMSIFASMAGVLQVARALADRDLSDTVLARGVENVLALVDGYRADEARRGPRARSAGRASS